MSFYEGQTVHSMGYTGKIITKCGGMYAVEFLNGFRHKLHDCSGLVPSGRGRFLYPAEMTVVVNEFERAVATYTRKELES